MFFATIRIPVCNYPIESVKTLGEIDLPFTLVNTEELTELIIDNTLTSNFYADENDRTTHTFDLYILLPARKRLHVSEMDRGYNARHYCYCASSCTADFCIKPFPNLISPWVNNLIPVPEVDNARNKCAFSMRDILQISFLIFVLNLSSI